MSIRTVRATVVDIRRDVPQGTDQLFVDTNSWRNLTYTRLQNPKTAYLDYLKAALSRKSTLYACGVTFVELASSIENDEWLIYREEFSWPGHKKEFRHGLLPQRERVAAEVRSSWEQVKQIAALIDVNVNEYSTSKCAERFASYPIDGNDLLIVEAMDLKGLSDILTDDCDFAALPGVRVFTANASVIAAARNQGMLIVR